MAQDNKENSQADSSPDSGGNRQPYLNFEMKQARVSKSGASDSEWKYVNVRRFSLFAGVAVLLIGLLVLLRPSGGRVWNYLNDLASGGSAIDNPPSSSSDSGMFWFFDSGYVELSDSACRGNQPVMLTTCLGNEGDTPVVLGGLEIAPGAEMCRPTPVLAVPADASEAAGGGQGNDILLGGDGPDLSGHSFELVAPTNEGDPLTLRIDSADQDGPSPADEIPWVMILLPSGEEVGVEYDPFKSARWALEIDGVKKEVPVADFGQPGAVTGQAHQVFLAYEDDGDLDLYLVNAPGGDSAPPGGNLAALVAFAPREEVFPLIAQSCGLADPLVVSSFDAEWEGYSGGCVEALPPLVVNLCVMNQGDQPIPATAIEIRDFVSDFDGQQSPAPDGETVVLGGLSVPPLAPGEEYCTEVQAVVTNAMTTNAMITNAPSAGDQGEPVPGTVTVLVLPRVEGTSSPPPVPVPPPLCSEVPPPVCPAGQFLCPDGSCVLTPSACEEPPPPDSGEESPGTDGSLCGDGICQAGESPDWCGDCAPGGDGGDGGGDGGTGACPAGQFQCSDGSCVLSPSACPPPPSGPPGGLTS